MFDRISAAPDASSNLVPGILGRPPDRGL